MQKIGAAVAWTVGLGAGAGLATVWTFVVLLFMRWPLYTLAVVAVVVATAIAIVAHGGRCHRLQLAQPSTGQLVVSPRRRVGETELREILGEETFLELSSLTGDQISE